MAKRNISYGKCFFCGQPIAKNVISRHLKSCPARQEEIAREAGRKEKPVRLFHLQVEGLYYPEYWMHLEMPASSTLRTLDNFLRAIWVECCGHLSAFTIRNIAYELNTGMVDAMWKEILGFSRPTRSMGVKLGDVLRVGERFFYEYDYGTTTSLKLKVVAEREGLRPPRDVRILARNYAPNYVCVECRQPATQIYTYEMPWHTYCDKHARSHEEWPDGFMPIVNSPRAGECGYTGPEAEELRFEERYPIPAEKA